MIQRGEEQNILVIMTSNSEKNLPDAFLRRCVFYHIPFPDRERLLQIVQTQIGAENQDYQFTDKALNDLISKFEGIRDRSNRKKAATAELVSWIRMLGIAGYMDKGASAQKKLIRQNLSILVKTQEDLEVVLKRLDEL